MSDTTVFEALRADHQTQRDLVAQLVETEGDSDDRADLFDRLRVELVAHADAEGRFFYIPMMEFDRTQEKARHSVAEHHELDELVEELQETDLSSPHWIATAEKLEHDLVHHLDEEEQEVFQMAGKVLTETQKTELAKSYNGEINRQRGQHA